MRIPIDVGHFFAEQGALGAVYPGVHKRKCNAILRKNGPVPSGWLSNAAMRRCASLIWSNQTALSAPYLAALESQRWASA